MQHNFTKLRTCLVMENKYVFSFQNLESIFQKLNQIHLKYSKIDLQNKNTRMFQIDFPKENQFTQDGLYICLISQPLRWKI